MELAPTVKRSLLFFFLGDFLFSLLIFIFINWLKAKIMLFHKGIYSSGYNLLFILWNFLQGFKSVLPTLL